MSWNPFHDHLDECVQCKSNPFDLCPVGVEAAEAIKKRLFNEGLDDFHHPMDEEFIKTHSNADAAYKKAVLDPLTEIFDKLGKSLDMENKSDD